jgi:cytochrome c55X
MTPRSATTTAALLTAAALSQAALAGVALAAEPPAPARQETLFRLLRQDCGSCHGLRLTGGLGPPLTAGALRDRPREMLAATVLRGRPGTAMPPWTAFLSETEADWLVSELIAGTVPDVR